MKIALQAVDRDAPLPHARRARLALREIRKMERLLSALAECGSTAYICSEELPLSELLAACASEVAEELALRQGTVSLQGEAKARAVRCDVGRVRPLLAQLLLDAADRQRGGGAVVARAHTLQDTVALELPLAPGVSGSAVSACVEALGLLLSPSGGGVHWTEQDGGGLAIRFPAAP